MSREETVPASRWRKTEAFLALVLWSQAALVFHIADLGPWREALILAATGTALLSLFAWPALQSARRGTLSAFQVTLVLSILLHGAGAFMMGSWVIVRTLYHPVEPDLALPLDSEALAQETLAVRIREEILPMELPDRVPAPALSVKMIPESVAEPMLVMPAVPQTEPFPPVPLTLRMSTPQAPEEQSISAIKLPPVTTAAGIRMEAREIAAVRKAAEPVDRNIPLKAAASTESLETALQRPVAGNVRWPESTGSPRESGIGKPRVSDVTAFGSQPLPALPATQRSVHDERPAPFVLRDPLRRKGMLEQLGSDEKTEQAVARALDWLQKVQEKDGRWAIARHGGRAGHEIAATGFALLCFYGWGARHDEPGPYQETVKKGMTWLIGRTSQDGDLTGGADHGMYDQGIATLALAEAYAITRDGEVRAPLQRAVDLILKSQSREHGAWRYRPDSKDGDTSVFGWQVMALRCAELGGIQIPTDAWTRAGDWLDWVGGGRAGGLYGYRTRTPKPAMVAQGMLCRHLMGASRESATMNESTASLLANPPDRRTSDYYYWYVGSLALHQQQGPAWSRWNGSLKEILLASQIRDGSHAGSWDARGAWGDACGRIVTTALATLSLEVYYRYVPSPGAK